MRTTVFALVLAFASVCRAGTIPVLTSSYVDFANDGKVPSSWTWSIGTEDGRRVTMGYGGLVPKIRWTQYGVDNPADAALFGANFDEWAAAAADPAYNLSIMTWNGVEHINPLQEFIGGIDRTEFKLHFFGMVVENYYELEPGNPKTISLRGTIVNDFAVPEPASVGLFMVGSIGLRLFVRRRFRQH